MVESNSVKPRWREERIWAIVAYVLHLFGAVLGLPSIAGLVINYVTKGDAPPELQSHHSWMIRTFWWSLFWMVIAIITWIFFIGMAIAFIIWVWWLYRHIRGLIRLFDNKAMPI